MSLVLDQTREQPGERVIADKQVVGREHLAFLGVEQEHQPHEDREQPFVDLMGAIGTVAKTAEELAPRLLIGCLETLQELEQGREHLLGKLCGDLVLILPALGQDVMQPLAAWEAVHPVVIEQRPQRRACQSTSRFEQGIERKADVSRLLPLRPIDQPDRCAVEDQAERDVGLVEEPLELLLGRFAPAGLIDLHRLAIEIDVRRALRARPGTTARHVRACSGQR